jgi:hypothetical protein
VNGHQFGAGDPSAAALRKQRQKDATARLEAAKKDSKTS